MLFQIHETEKKNHFSRTRHGIEWDMEDRRQRRQRIQGKQRRQKRQRKCHFYVPLFHFIFEWKCKLQFAKCRPGDAFIWRYLIKINTIKAIRFYDEKTKWIVWLDIHTSAGNLFKFCCRASTEYQVAVSN